MQKLLFSIRSNQFLKRLRQVCLICDSKNKSYHINLSVAVTVVGASLFVIVWYKSTSSREKCESTLKRWVGKAGSLRDS